MSNRTNQRGTDLSTSTKQTDLMPSRDETKIRSGHESAKTLARGAVNAILDKKGRDVVVLDMHEVSGVADVFVIATGDSDMQVRAITDSIRVKLKETCHERPWHVEGTDHFQWVVLDYVDVVVHVFHPEKREFYDLERLWGDAPREEVPDEGAAEDLKLLREESP